MMLFLKPINKHAAYLLLLSIRAISFFFAKIYKGVVRYTSSKDAIRILTVVIAGSVLMYVANIVLFCLGFYVVSTQVIITDCLITLL